MLKYIRHIKGLFTWKNQENEPIGELLNDEQKRKYRKQYLGIMGTALFITLSYIITIVWCIKSLFTQNQVAYIAFVILLLRDYTTQVHEWKNGIELIIERIEKRTKKNKKQQRED